MATKKRSGDLTNRYKKQHGLHHKHTGKYIKVYWPYLPVLAIVILGIVGSVIVLVNKPDNDIATSAISVNTLFGATNNARKSSDVQPLKISLELTKAAQIKANDMAVNDYWAPISPSGTTPWQVIKSTGYQYQTAGENLAYGFSSAGTLSSAWLSSPSHKQNMVNANYTDVGYGVAISPDYQSQGPETIVVALYASTTAPLHSLPTDNQTFTSASISQPKTQTIAKAESITGGNSLLLIFISGLSIGILGCYLIVKHGLLFKKWALEGEEIILKHPFLDIIMVVVIIGCASLNQTIGFLR